MSFVHDNSYTIKDIIYLISRAILGHCKRAPQNPKKNAILFQAAEYSFERKTGGCSSEMYYIIRLIRECYNPKWHIIYNIGFFLQ